MKKRILITLSILLFLSLSIWIFFVFEPKQKAITENFKKPETNFQQHVEKKIKSGNLLEVTNLTLTNKPNHLRKNYRQEYAQYLAKHPFNNRELRKETETERGRKGEKETESVGEEERETDHPELAWEQDFLRTMDPVLKRPAPEKLSAVLTQMKQGSLNKTNPGNASSPWVERGPNNVGGRTRALVFDPNDITQKKVWSGGVNGGLWYNNDITDANSSWLAVNDFWSNISISAIVFDPTNTQVIYVATGESYTSGFTGTHSGNRGAGIWKSTNGGLAWTQISSTTGFYYINDIVVRNESGTGVVYAAVDGGFYNGIFHGAAAAGIQRSVNGGTTWTQVLPNIPSMSVNFVASDIEIAANNALWVGTKGSPYSATDRGGGRILTSSNGTTWTISNSTTVTNGYGRVEIACAPSDTNYVYAVIEDAGAVSTLKKTINSGSAWTTITKPVDADLGIPSTDFSRGQAMYDLILAIDPTNASTAIVGGIDLFRTTNAGTNWSQISKWSDNSNMNTLTCSTVHADQHAIVFKPGSASTVIFGNDGGIFYTASISTAATSSVIASRNKNYNVTQFYSCAMHPTSANNIYLAGAQDNGTQRYTNVGVNTTTDVTGGDGAYCFIDQTNGNYQVASYTYNNYYLSTNNGVLFGSTLLSDAATGRFINVADYDNNLHILYSCKGAGTLYRIKNITTTPTAAATITLTGMTDYASNITVSPYTTATTTLFVGTEAGALYKVTNADGTPTTTNITGASFPAGSISCVEIGASENELLVTFFNYGVTSVWYSSNGGSSWVSKEGSLPDMPVRWALFNPTNRNEVILATELGIWACTDFNLASPTWTASANGMANVRVDMLQIRSSDNQVIAATHGRGLFSSNAFAISCAAPTTQASNITFSNVFANQMTVNCTAGNGSRRLIYMNTSNSFIAPTNATDPVANSNYGGLGQQLVYNGTGTSVAITGLTISTNYYFMVYEANCTGSSSFYQTATATNNPNSQLSGTVYPTVYRINEPFNSVLTPAGWTINNTGNLLLWNSTVNAYNSTSNIGCVKANNFNVSSGNTGILETRSFYPTAIGDSLKFDIACAGYGSGNLDSLSVFAFNGSTYTKLRAWKSAIVVDTGITTVVANTSEYLSTLSTDWRTKKIALPVGTTKVHFRWYSGFGNTIFTDNIIVDSFYSIPQSPLNGTYTVGTGGSYTTLTAAVNDLNLRGVSGAVNFNLINNNYSTNETFPITINNFVGSSATNKVTIKPTLVNTTITGNNTLAIIFLNGTKNVIIDGAVSGNNRNLLIQNTNSTVANSGVVIINSLGALQGAANDTIRNLNVTAGVNTIIEIGIWVNGADNQNIGINNVRVEKATHGIYVNGTVSGPVNNIRITNSSMGSTLPSNYISYSGIYLQNTINSLVDKDTIFNILTAFSDAPALYAGYKCNAITISNNLIDSNRYTGTVGYGSRGIVIKTGLASSNISVFNNFVSRIGGDGWSGYNLDNIMGIAILPDTLPTGGVNVYNNSVWLMEVFSGNATATNSFAFYVGSGATNLNVRNNLFYNSIVNTNSGATGSKAYSFASETAASGFTTLNYNNYLVGGSQGMLAYFGAADKANLTLLKAATTKDVNSVSLPLIFVASSNLHLSGSSIGNYNLKCVPVPGITTDIDGETRNATWHYMGADENIGSPLPVVFTYFSAKPKNNDALIDWSCVLELNNDGFIVERSSDNINFREIGFVKGGMNSNQITQYTFTDFGAKHIANGGVLFYRLAQLDLNENKDYSASVLVNFNKEENNFTLYPNPFVNALNLMTDGLSNGTATITLTDILGNTVHTTTLNVSNISNNYSINGLTQLPAGIYFVKVNCNGIEQTIKVSKCE